MHTTINWVASSHRHAAPRPSTTSTASRATSSSKAKENYDYDALDRLIGVSRKTPAANENIRYHYDANGNRTELNTATETIRYQRAEHSNRLITVKHQSSEKSSPLPSGEGQGEGASIQYDPAGNRIEDARLHYRYNARGRLAEVTDKQGNTIARYRYNALGLRTHKITDKQIMFYVYNPNGTLVAEYISTKNKVAQLNKQYLWLGTLPIAVLDYTQGENKPRLYYLHADHLGTPRMATDEHQNVTWQWQSTPFGVGDAKENGLVLNLRFPGQYFDGETGLHYNWWRYYEPIHGRYISGDPTGPWGGLNLYVYGFNYPIKNIDPLGLWSTEAHNYLIQEFGKRNEITQLQMQVMMRGSAYADSFFAGFQGQNYSYMHAMTSKAIPSKKEACKLANQFIKKNMDNFYKLLSNPLPMENVGFRGGNIPNTLDNPYYLLGMAMHTVMDNKSPAHAGFQPWDNSQVGRHGDDIPLTPFGSHTEEDLQSLISRPDLITQTLDDMSNLLINGQLINCSCYQ